APGVPVHIAETACPEDARKPRWIRDLWRWAEAEGIASVGFFDIDKRDQGECDWRLDSSPASRRAFVKAAGGGKG
ncbi:MAG: hypothetical protein M3Q74_13245, partial [Pseudomonadota bacterium]|nr:hypothetical protein [Pseudomonadota bacterium]